MAVYGLSRTAMVEQKWRPCFLQVRGGNRGSRGKCCSECSFEEIEDACV